KELVVNVMDGDPATLLYLALRGIELEDVRERFSVNRCLDAIGKITLARERRYGDAWTEEGLHPGALISEWETAFSPLREALTVRFMDKVDRLTALLAKIIPGPEIDEHYDAKIKDYQDLRRTRESLLALEAARRPRLP